MIQNRGQMLNISLINTYQHGEINLSKPRVNIHLLQKIKKIKQFKIMIPLNQCKMKIKSAITLVIS